MVTTKVAAFPTPRILSGLSQIAADYDGFLVDLWGCVHNGIEPYAAAVEALLNLTGQGKQVCLLSNGPRRASVLVERLDQMGVPRNAYHHVMSSGEAAWLALKQRSDQFHAELGDRCFRLGPERDASVHTGNGLHLVDEVQGADFVLCTGPFDHSDAIEAYADLLELCANLKLPMVCANPDLVVHIGREPVICAGLIASRFEELGGQVVYHGKPHRSVYEPCQEYLAGIPHSRVLGIGDGLRTDVKGAADAGVDSLFLTSGIHLEEIGRGSLTPSKVAEVGAEVAAIPTYAMPALRW